MAKPYDHDSIGNTNQPRLLGRGTCRGREFAKTRLKYSLDDDGAGLLNAFTTGNPFSGTNYSDLVLGGVSGLSRGSLAPFQLETRFRGQNYFDLVQGGVSGLSRGSLTPLQLETHDLPTN